MNNRQIWNVPRRLLVLALSAAMVLPLLPLSSLAEEGDDTYPSCSCVTACTAEAVNADCPVCGAEGADYGSLCTGEKPEPEPELEKENCAHGNAPEGCALCTVQALIDALPVADSITVENADAAGAQLTAIDEAMAGFGFGDAEKEQLDLRAYNVAIHMPTSRKIGCTRTQTPLLNAGMALPATTAISMTITC